jgi:hypothetical protein
MGLPGNGAYSRVEEKARFCCYSGFHAPRGGREREVISGDGGMEREKVRQYRRKSKCPLPDGPEGDT